MAVRALRPTDELMATMEEIRRLLNSYARAILAPGSGLLAAEDSPPNRRLLWRCGRDHGDRYDVAREDILRDVHLRLQVRY